MWGFLVYDGEARSVSFSSQRGSGKQIAGRAGLLVIGKCDLEGLGHLLCLSHILTMKSWCLNIISLRRYQQYKTYIQMGFENYCNCLQLGFWTYDKKSEVMHKLIQLNNTSEICDKYQTCKPGEFASVSVFERFVTNYNK